MGRRIRWRGRGALQDGFGNGIGVRREPFGGRAAWLRLRFDRRGEPTAERLISGSRRAGPDRGGGDGDGQWERMPIDRLLEANTVKFATRLSRPGRRTDRHAGCEPVPFEGASSIRGLKGASGVPTFLFPGTNCDYDSAKAFRKAGAEVRTTVFRNLSGADVMESIAEMKKISAATSSCSAAASLRVTNPTAAASSS